MRKLYISAFAATALVAIACGSAGAADSKGPGDQGAAGDSTGKKTSTSHTYVLEVTGSGKLDVNYSLNADSSSANGVASGWKKSMVSGEQFQSVSLVVSTESQSDGAKVTCKITRDGKVVKQNSGSGAMSNATCATDTMTQP